MDRLEATRLAADLAGNAPIIGSTGNAAFDLAETERPGNFYLWNSMGMASSIGLGLALARPDKRVVILDGDGSLLMNLSALPTAHMAGANNLVHVVWDNGGWDITGGQPAGSAFGIDLEAIARGSGLEATATVDTVEAFRDVFLRALADDRAWFIVARVNPGDATARPSKNLVQIRDQFMEALA
jgi:thiamine pyrophosphate-dependent acetolactate synthase large subunit-like protein